MESRQLLIWSGIVVAVLVPVVASLTCWMRPVEGSFGRRLFSGLHGVLALAALGGGYLLAPATARDTALVIPLLAGLVVLSLIILASSIAAVVVHRRSIGTIVLVVLAAPLELFFLLLAAVTIAHFQWKFV